MKQIDVREQVRLPFSTCMELVLSGLRFRLFRAAITVAIIALAVAFLMTMLGESVVSRQVARVIRSQTAPRDNFIAWVDRLSTPFTESQVSEELLAAGGDSGRRAELTQWGHLSAGELDQMISLASRQQVYLRFFAELGEGRRRPLVGRAQGSEIFRMLQQAEPMANFESRLGQLDRPMPNGGLEGLRAFLAEWSQTQPLRQRIIAGHGEALLRLRSQFGDTPPKQMLAEASGDLPARLAELGFRLSSDELSQVREQAKLSLDTEAVLRTLASTVVKTRLAGRTNVKISDVNAQTLLNEVSSSGGAEWLVELAAGSPTPLTLAPQRVQEVARARLSENRLAQVEAGLLGVDDATTILGFPPRTMWLIAVSFLVCVIGIANAMLMSVTERFREIATMKCLGSTDGFIMVNFILESCMQGFAGGVMGAIVGFLLASLRSWASYGWMAIDSMPLGWMFGVAGASLAMGIVLAALAAVYPAWIAARLAPMEAMRIE